MRQSEEIAMNLFGMRGLSRALSSLPLATALLVAGAGGALADRIKNPIAVFAGLDKITGRIIAFEVATGETVQFGSLQITARVCYTRPRTEAPQTTTFVEVDEIDTKNEYKRIFNGWMYAASPGLHGVEHPVYDIWLTDCKGGTTVIVDPKPVEAAPPSAEEAARPPKPGTTPRPRRGGEPDAAGQPGLEGAGGPIEVRPPPGAGQPAAQQPGALPSGAALPPLPGRPTPPAAIPGGLVPPGAIPDAPAEPRRQPSQRFFPTNPGQGRDPAGNN